MINTGMALSGNVSADISVVRGTAVGGTIELRLTLFSTSASLASVAFLYRRDFLDEWKTDAIITASNARFVSSNEMYCLPCSSQGTENILIWDHAANGISAGSNIAVKAVVVPSAAVMCSTGSFSRIETSFKGGYRDITSGMLETVVGFDEIGNAVVTGDHLASLIDLESKTTETVAVVQGNVAHAVGFPGGIIVAETNGTLSEFDLNGTLVRSLDASAYASGDISLALHPAARTLLVSGGNIPAVNEIYWGGETHGTVLWSYACPLDSLPSGVTYGDGLGTVAFCELGGNRVVVIDRTSSPQSVSIVSSVVIDGQTVPLSKPVRCAVVGGVVYVVEESGVKRAFGSTPSSHPSMARAGMGTATGSDALPQYSGMCFVPIVRSVK